MALGNSLNETVSELAFIQPNLTQLIDGFQVEKAFTCQANIDQAYIGIGNILTLLRHSMTSVSSNLHQILGLLMKFEDFAGSLDLKLFSNLFQETISAVSQNALLIGIASDQIIEKLSDSSQESVSNFSEIKQSMDGLALLSSKFNHNLNFFLNELFLLKNQDFNNFSGSLDDFKNSLTDLVFGFKREILSNITLALETTSQEFECPSFNNVQEYDLGFNLTIPMFNISQKFEPMITAFGQEMKPILLFILISLICCCVFFFGFLLWKIFKVIFIS